MGIQRLLHHMQDFGTTVELGTAWQNHATPSPTEHLKPEPPKQVVVDGPSLAYHAYHRAVAGRYHARNALEAMPSHGEVAAGAAHFLETLESHNLKIAAIYFDGALPEAKHKTRLRRLLSSLNQLQSFKNLHPNEVRCIPPKIQADAFSAPTSSPEKLNALPAAPFLVPAVIDHLSQSRFAQCVYVVPGEADVFCAASTRTISHTEECWLLSSDTDLLIFDLGPKGSVLRFQDIGLATFPRRTVLKGIEYHPKLIAERLGLNALAPLAFALTQDPHRSLQELVRVAKSLDLSDAEYKAWMKEYASLHGAPLHASADPSQPAITRYLTIRLLSNGKLSADAPRMDSRKQRSREESKAEQLPAYLRFMNDGQLKILDPRVSELVHQVIHGIVTHTDLEGLDPADNVGNNCAMFLPFLIDDPVRASAWRLSADLRQLAYSILSLPMSSLITIEEFERRGPRIASSVIPRFRYKQQEIIKTCQELSAHISAFMVNSGDLHLKAPLYFWKLYGALYLCDKLVQNDERQASKNQVLRLLQGQQGQLEWSYIHRVAQLQGVWYSLRMLRQFFGVFLSFPLNTADKTSIHADAAVQAAVKDAYERLDGLPSAAKFFDPVPAEDEDAVPESYLLAAIENFPSVAEDPKDLYDRAMVTRKSKKRKKEKQGQAERGGAGGGARNGPQPQTSGGGGNMFGALSALGDGN